MFNPKSGFFIFPLIITLLGCGDIPASKPSTTMDTRSGRDIDSVLPTLFSRIEVQRALELDQRARAARYVEASAIAAAKVESVRNNKPAMIERWKRLSRGEFEPPETFRERKEREKLKETAEYEKALREWQERLAAVQKEQANSLPSSQANVQSVDAASLLPSTVIFEIYPRKVLPRFDQEAMLFSAVDLNYSSGLLTFGSRTYGRVRTQGLDRLYFKASSLALAEKFKKYYESGHIKIIVQAVPIIEREESPVQTGTKTVLAGSGLDGGIIENLNYDRPLTSTEPVYDKNGNLYHVLLKVNTVNLADSDGNQVPGVTLENEKLGH